MARRYALDNSLIVLDVASKVTAMQGLTHDRFIDLQDAGLLDPSSSSYVVTFGPAPTEWHFAYQDREMRVRAPASNGTTSITLFARRLTRIGQEIATVLPFAPDELYFSECASRFCQILNRPNCAEWKLRSEKEWRCFTTSA